MIELYGFGLALLIGIVLGLIGSGGSILAVPIFTYIFLLDEKLATGYSLFVVGFGALVGVIKQYQKKNIDFKAVVVFGLPAVISVTMMRSLVVPFLPEILFDFGEINITRRMGILGLFAIVMIPAAWAFIKSTKTKTRNFNLTSQNYNYTIIIFEGLIVGSITGIVGAGGGFLIIPVLVIFLNMSIKIAIGTSILIVASKSLIGFFIGDVLSMEIDWTFLISFTAIAGSGVIIGNYLNSMIDEKKLRNIFGYFILFMSAFIFFQEFIK